ncbi:Molybdopterin or thiamine biosynthesis adenylyltransferase [Paenibacillus polysaccharolyticus]|uniref:Molybdopterin or thiamine biosynthesis adenylyltransferase n=1 Tax=Paenibacillus polysaccharolyticus TaxID=582692 RepID=A0A1G5B2Q6_9BACL|nr:ThiF family adenylyltransferase [Paenibacillus polysaccharolyticus]SCX84350.1 Molybdopterin or thiamine biosynthesis adenylyltransferase [Paenibacillus polysaccharolyticus]
MRPKFKNVMNPIVRSGDNIRLGFEREVFEIEDKDGVILQFIMMLNGENTLEDLISKCGLTTREIMDGLEALDSIGVIEDFDANVEGLTLSELDRYRANLTFFSNFSDLKQGKYSYQSRLKHSKVVVLGLGGASLTAASLVGLGVGQVIGVDYDTVELSNLNRQFLYTEDSVGSFKSHETEKRLKQINKDIIVNVHNLKVTSPDDILDIISGSDLVINGIDSPGIVASRWVNAACVYHKVPIVQGGISNTKIIWETILPDCGCYDCFLIRSLRVDKHFEHQLRALYETRYEDTNSAVAPHVALLSGFLSAEVLKLLTNYTQSMLPSTTHVYDTAIMDILKSESWSKLDECPTCGIDGNCNEPISLERLIDIANNEVHI